MKAIIAIAGVAIVFALSGCGRVTRAWTEDVLLDDGSTIRVERTVNFTESNSLSGDSYNATETDATIAFTGDYANLPVWRQPLMALLLYRDQTTDEWVVVATTTTCRVWQLRGQPDPIYWEFRLRGQEWQEIRLSEASFGRPSNLLHAYHAELNTRHITAVERRRLESRSDRMFKAIVPDAKPNCMPTLRIGTNSNTSGEADALQH